MSSFYSNLLSPLKIGGVVLKNRMMATNSMPHFLQGPESFPADSLMYYFEKQARNGAAIITFPNRRDSLKHMQQNDMRHFAVFDVDDETVQNYLSQLADTVHFYGSRASFDLWPPQMAPEGACNTLDIERELDETIEKVVPEAKLYQSLGFDMTSIYMPYRAGIAAQLLSPLTNHRTDRFGGGIENRARYILEICRAVKEACGQDFLIDVRFSGLEEPGGITIDDTVAFSKIAEGLIDIFQLRAADADLTHPIGFNSKPGEHITLKVAQAIKESGSRVVVAPSGGFQDLEENDRYIAEGKADMIAMARAFICDPEYGRKATEGRGKDVVPCLRCNKCHVSSLSGPWVCVCSVNPELGMGHKLKRMVDAPERKKRVAIVGGGPAGMRAALYAADRGHDVTLFEKKSRLGGQTICADGPDFKWPVRKYRDYLIDQLDSKGVDVRLNTEADRELLEKEKFDAVIAAVGCEHVPTPVPGAEGKNVFTPIQVYGHESEIGKTVVVIGGSQKSVETAMYLAQLGHDVTLLTRRDRLAYDATPIHYYEQMEKSWSELDGFRWMTGKHTVRITENGVVYTENTDDREHLLPADSVVASGGVRPLQKLAMSLHGAAPEFYMIGDCEKAGCIHDATRRAFAAASQI